MPSHFHISWLKTLFLKNHSLWHWKVIFHEGSLTVVLSLFFQANKSLDPYSLKERLIILRRCPPPLTQTAWDPVQGLSPVSKHEERGLVPKELNAATVSLCHTEWLSWMILYHVMYDASLLMPECPFWSRSRPSHSGRAHVGCWNWRWFNFTLPCSASISHSRTTVLRWLNWEIFPASAVDFTPWTPEDGSPA